MQETEKQYEYAVILSEKIAELFDEEGDSALRINAQEFEDSDNVTAFIHALANVMPTRVYNNLTGDNKNNLEFNHIANRLVFQYSKKD